MSSSSDFTAPASFEHLPAPPAILLTEDSTMDTQTPRKKFPEDFAAETKRLRKEQYAETRARKERAKKQAEEARKSDKREYWIIQSHFNATGGKEMTVMGPNYPDKTTRQTAFPDNESAQAMADFMNEIEHAKRAKDVTKPHYEYEVLVVPLDQVDKRGDPLYYPKKKWEYNSPVGFKSEFYR